jgi:hypothetical protein
MSETGWAIFINSDLTEGRGFECVKAICKLEATARRLAHRANVQGSDGIIRPVELHRQDGVLHGPIQLEMPTKADEAAQKQLDAARHARAKAKELGLSDEEIALLGHR